MNKESHIGPCSLCKRSHPQKGQWRVPNEIHFTSIFLVHDLSLSLLLKIKERLKRDLLIWFTPHLFCVLPKNPARGK